MKGISFSAQMVKAWLAGNKTVTRRLIKVPPIGISGLATPEEWNRGRADTRMPAFETWGPQSGTCLFRDDRGRVYGLKPRYHPGETVYIKETWRKTWSGGSLDLGYEVEIEYRAKMDVSHGYMGKTVKVPEMHHGYKLTKKGKSAWQSPMMMNEIFSRSHARIISVRPEQIQNITPEEVKKEGLVVQDFAGVGVLSLLGLTPQTYMEHVSIQVFQGIWDTLHPGSWEANSWIWRIELNKEEE